MKKIFIILLLPLISQSQSDILSARNIGVGNTVTITGIVTNGDELGAIRYIQDNTAGLGLYDPTILNSVNRGDELTVTGVLVDYNGLLEMQPVNNLNLNSTNNNINPQLVTPNQIGENTEGELIQINNVVFNNGGGTFSGNNTYDFSSSGQIGKIYIRNGHSLENTFIPMGPVTLIGISSQYTFNIPANDGYQILPRDSSDIIQSGSILFTSGVTQSNITNNSFDLSWNVSTNSSTNCNYGLSNNLGNHINNSSNTQFHTITLTGLQPATFYYVQCYSIDGIDTAFSSVGLYSTSSNSTGKIRPYFNHSVDNSFSTGSNANNIGSSFRDTIAAYMNLAQTSLDICVYNASSIFLADAINDAYNRGVQVRYIADDDGLNSMLPYLDPGIQVVYRDPNTAGIMHNKFMIIDANSINNSWIMGGSTNWTDPSNLMNDYNNLIFIQDQSIAKAYTIEFEEMWGGVFGTHKTDNTPHKFNVNGVNIEIYFSPSDKTTSKIIDFIDNVDKTLEFGLLNFTRDDIRDAVINKDIEFGVVVRGIIEQQNINGSEFDTLINSNVNVRSHQGITHQLHHKYAIADANYINDNPAVLTGSHNWSSNAENNSDENTIIIYDHTIANIYIQEFEKRWSELGSSTNIDGSNNDLIIELYPNPSDGNVNINTNKEINYLSIYNSEGKFIMNAKSNKFTIAKPGLYFIAIIFTDGNYYLNKFVVK
tara:strand:- start:58213 stop:60339 length:2127 start_codon:yes stop_codon:yes gene_type:complete